MRPGPSSLTFALLAAILITLAGCSTALTNESPPPDGPLPMGPPPSPTRSWSDAAAWPGGKLPVAGADVTIPQGEVVLLDMSPPPLAGLVIDGSLVFDERDLSLTSDLILVHGGLYIGTEDAPFEHRAVITLTGPVTSPSYDAAEKHMGSKVLAVMGGVLEIYAKTTGPSWTRLVQTAEAGAATIQLADPAGWKAGSRLAVASTDYGSWNDVGDGLPDRDVQVEERTVTAVSGNQLTLDHPLDFMHYGALQTFGDRTLDERAEVARLERNVVIRGDADSAKLGSDRYGFGGHVMAMGTSRMRIDGVEFTRLGQMGRLARYPVHFHLMGDKSKGSFVRNSSIHHNFNRCLTIHGSNGVVVEDVVGYDTYGHCFFLEDGAETGNTLRGNLSLMTRKAVQGKAILASDRDDYLGPAGFWITNPDNVVVDNVAASSQGTGFWYALPEHPTGPSFRIFNGQDAWPRRTPLGRFAGNVAHSNNVSGLHVDNGPSSNGSDTEVAPYRPRMKPANLDSQPVLAVFEDFTAYRHRHRGVWFRGDNAVLRASMLADNAIGATFASNETWVEDSVFVGESANLGTPSEWETPGLDGRSLPRPWDDGVSFAIRGFEFYDGQVWAKDSTFVNFEPNAQRMASALSFLDYTSFSMSPLSHVSGLSFAPNTQRLFLETRMSSDLTDDDGEDGYRSGLFIDQDGSVTGTAGKVVTVANPLLKTPTCSVNTTWNAYVCDARYASLTYYNTDPNPGTLAPISISRDAALSHVMLGSPAAGPNTYFRTLLPLGFEYRYDYSGYAPRHLRLNLQDITNGESLVVSLTYSGAKPVIYRDWWIDDHNLVPEVSSAAAVRAAHDAAWYYDTRDGRLYVRFVQQDDKDYAEFEVCRLQLCR